MNGEIGFGAYIDTSQFSSDVQRIRQGFANAAAGVQRDSNAMSNSLVNIEGLLVKIGGVAAFTKLASDVVRVRGEFQKTQVAFETMLGSKEKADTLMAQMVQTAAKTPFDLQGVANGAKQLLAYGTEAEDVNDTLVRLGNIASGLSIPLGDMVYLYGTTQTQGRLFTQDVRQFMGRGIPLVKELASMLGKTEEEINAMVTAGKIGFPDVEKVIKKMTDEGGKFHNLMEKQSQTLSGQISNLGDAWDGMLNSIGEETQGLSSATISMATSVVENYVRVGKILVALIATYGAYRTAVIIASVTTNGWTIATMLQYRALLLAEKAQKLLNATMLKNPYVLAATLVIGAAAAMWALHDGTTAAEKAQKKFNEEKEEAIKREVAHKSQIESLISTIQDETAAEMNRIGAMDKLKAAYPHIFAKYVDEKGHLTDIIALKKEIEEFDAKVSVGVAKRQADRAKQELIKVNSEINYREGSTTGASKFFRNKTTSELREMQSGLLQSYQLKQSEYDKLAELDAKAKAKMESATVTQNKSYWEKQKKDAETALDSIASKQRVLLDAGKFDGIESSVVANYKTQSKLLEEAQKELKVYDTTGKYSRQEESAAEKLRKQNEKLKELASKQTIEQARSEEDLQNQVDQSRISSMKEGSEKILAQMELDHEKELQVIDRQMEDLLLKKKSDAKSSFEANPANQGKSFDDSNVILSDSELKQFDSLYKALLGKQSTDTDVFYKSVTDKYQDYTTQRLAIEKQFNADIAILQEERKRAQESGDTGKVETTDRAIAQATTDKGKALIGLDYEQLKQSPEYVRAFENLKQTSSETLNSLLSQLENAKGTAAKVLSPDQLREYTTTIQDIMNELDERNPWQALSDKKQELADAEQELAQAQIELESARQTADAVKGGAKIESGISSSKYNPKTGKIDSSKAYLTEAQALDKVKAKTDNYNKSKDKVAEKSAKVKKSEKDVTDQIDELSKAISDVGNSIGGPAGEIISLIGDIGSFTMMAINGVKMAADTSAQAISTVEKASVILMIISAAIQLATKVMSFFAADYSDYNESKENYEKYVEVLDVIISKQKELIETLTGEAAVRASKDALDLIEKQAQAARNLGKERLNAGASAGSHSIGVRIKDSMSESGWNEALNAIGAGDYNKIKDGRMTGLFDLSVQQLNKLQMEAPEFWAKLDEDVREYLEQIIACNENAEELKGILNESLTGVSFDSVSENFLDALSDMDTSAADFADNFSSYMQKAILNTMMAKTYEKRLNDWYESFANANKDGDIDSLDYDKLQKDWEGIVSDALLDRDKLKDLFGWTSGESSSQDSTNGGFQAMSQDTGDELNGRFTALQIAGEETKNQMMQQTPILFGLSINMDIVKQYTQTISLNVSEMKDIALTSMNHLSGIEKNTKQLYQMNERLGKIEQNTKNM